MKMNAPDIRNSDNSTYNSPDDPRVTKVGKFIRRTSIDELPQFFNVLIGDMSFIGPKPTNKPIITTKGIAKSEPQISNKRLKKLLYIIYTISNLIFLTACPHNLTASSRVLPCVIT